MKKTIGILFLIFIIIATTFSFAAYPADLEAEELKQISEETAADDSIQLISEEADDKSQIIDDDVYRMENEVLINETIDGNVYAMGQTVKIEDATIYGNLYVMAEEIEVINSDISASVYAIGEKINFSGMTSDVYVLGKDIDFDLDSYVWRSIKAVGKNININGNIGRDVYAEVENLFIGDEAVIEGELNYSSENQGNISENAQISQVQFNQQEKIDSDEKEEINVMGYVKEALTVGFKTLVVALIIVFFVNKFKTLKRTDNIAMDFAIDAAKGSFAVVIIPIIAILLMFTIIGLGFGVVILALYIISLYITIPVSSIEIAHRIIAKKSKENEVKKSTFIGISVLVSLAIWVISLIPVFGTIINAILVLIGLGTIFELIFQKNKKEVINEN